MYICRVRDWKGLFLSPSLFVNLWQTSSCCKRQHKGVRGRWFTKVTALIAIQPRQLAQFTHHRGQWVGVTFPSWKLTLSFLSFVQIKSRMPNWSASPQPVPVLSSEEMFPCWNAQRRYESSVIHEHSRQINRYMNQFSTAREEKSKT